MFVIYWVTGPARGYLIGKPLLRSVLCGLVGKSISISEEFMSIFFSADCFRNKIFWLCSPKSGLCYRGFRQIQFAQRLNESSSRQLFVKL
jgi:hypothetical protein